jgi:hypothetical protein
MRQEAVQLVSGAYTERSDCLSQLVSCWPPFRQSTQERVYFPQNSGKKCCNKREFCESGGTLLTEVFYICLLRTSHRYIVRHEIWGFVQIWLRHSVHRYCAPHPHIRDGNTKLSGRTVGDHSRGTCLISTYVIGSCPPQHHHPQAPKRFCPPLAHR